QAEFKRVQQEQMSLAYDKDYHFGLRTELQQLRAFAEQYSSLAEIKANLPGDEELLLQLIQQRDRELAECQNHRETIALLEGQLTRLAEVEREHPTVKAEVLRLRQEKSRLESQLGALEEKLNHLASLKKQRKEKLGLREEAARTKQLFSQLVTAFGKRGIQAMIIENAIPELQDEANDLLARMSDGRMHLTLLTQRDNKKGGVTETLDIRIADEMGTRKYEMFSGGEAFRVNFALRIALSKLLARRAGAKLQTLVIDEGFGTQDGAGRERLIEVINAIKDDFAKIIIITHIQELKDAFPIQIEVEKTADGSCLKFM
ncbi:MAG TPA: SbcC/MukB-like Walker B domain-containing protein, partial [Verrucomicrobiae bacterium]|nr:SbcC/MukB-like Walker B domain-containing protein [Verrucomicrobiae bacterium]